jgi:hypothetical protein
MFLKQRYFMKKSTALFLLASTAIASNTLATSEAVSTETTAVMSPTDIKALNDIAHKIDFGSFEQTIISLIDECDQQGEKLDIAQLIQEMASKMSEAELKEMLAQLLPKAIEKAETAQCDNCTLLKEEIQNNVIALEKNQLNQVTTAAVEKAEEIKTELGLN